MVPPLFVVSSESAGLAATRQLDRDGWCVQRGLTLPREPWDVSSRKLIVSGVVADRSGIAAVLAAATRGAGVLAICPVEELVTVLVAELGRIGPVRSATTAPAPAASDHWPTGFTTDHAALLERLGKGESVAAAADAEFLSLRTANRRLAQARAALGVRTTREAVAAYARLLTR